jgi:hypothetical protein
MELKYIKAVPIRELCEKLIELGVSRDAIEHDAECLQENAMYYSTTALYRIDFLDKLKSLVLIHQQGLESSMQDIEKQINASNALYM